MFLMSGMYDTNMQVLLDHQIQSIVLLWVWYDLVLPFLADHHICYVSLVLACHFFADFSCQEWSVTRPAELVKDHLVERRQ